MQFLDRGAHNTAFRVGDQVQPLIVSDEPGDTLAFIGWVWRKNPIWTALPPGWVVRGKAKSK